MDSIEEALSEIYGKFCWGLSYDSQLNLSMSFGDPVLEVREPRKSNSKSPQVRALFAKRRVTVKGLWWLWIYCSYWKLSFAGERAASSSSSYIQKSRAIVKLEGQILTHAAVKPLTGATRFGFDLGGVLEVRRFERNSKRDLWMLYKPDGCMLAVRGDGKYINELSSTKGEYISIAS